MVFVHIRGEAANNAAVRLEAAQEIPFSLDASEGADIAAGVDLQHNVATAVFDVLGKPDLRLASGIEAPLFPIAPEYQVDVGSNRHWKELCALGAECRELLCKATLLPQTYGARREHRRAGQDQPGPSGGVRVDPDQRGPLAHGASPQLPPRGRSRRSLPAWPKLTRARGAQSAHGASAPTRLRPGGACTEDTLPADRRSRRPPAKRQHPRWCTIRAASGGRCRRERRQAGLGQRDYHPTALPGEASSGRRSREAPAAPRRHGLQTCSLEESRRRQPPRAGPSTHRRAASGSEPAKDERNLQRARGCPD